VFTVGIYVIYHLHSFILRCEGVVVKLTSKDATLVPAMAVVSAVGHMAVGPFVNRAFHVPGPTLAGVVIMAPLLVAGALTFRRGMIMLTSILNGMILSPFVPIGFMAIPIYAVVGLTLELFCLRSFSVLFRSSRAFVAAGVANAISVLLIAALALSLRNPLVLAFAVGIGFLAGGFGGTIASATASRIRALSYPNSATSNPNRR
jgi:hypothetical protein